MSSPPSQTLFDEALSRFQNSLRPKEKAKFTSVSSSANDFLAELKKLEGEQAAHGTLRNLRRIQPYVNGLRQFSEVIGVFVQAKPEILSFIWGPTLFLLERASAFTYSFERLVEALEKIGENLPRFQLFADTFDGSPRVQQTLLMVYEDVLKFYQSTLKYFRAPGWQQLFKGLWTTFDDTFGRILQNLERHRLLLDNEANAAHIVDSRAYVARATKDSERARLRDIKDWLEPVNYLHDQESFATIRHCYSTSGKWLIEHQTMKEWLTSGSPIESVWLTGIPGAGKTLLTSAVVETAVKQATQDDAVVVFAFLGRQKEKMISDPVHSILKTFLFQLLSQQRHLLQYFLDVQEECSFCSPTQTRLLELLQTTLSMSGSSYMVLDGLDEIDNNKTSSYPSQREQLLSALADLSYQVDSLKIFVSSRFERDIDAALPQFTRLQVGEHNREEIKRYVEMEGEVIVTKLGTNDEVRQEITRILGNVTERAHGMFLWARLVLYHLRQQHTLIDLKSVDEDLPDGLDEAYSRIKQRIERNLTSVQRENARRVLETVICARSTLKADTIKRLFEIQAGSRSLNNEGRLLVQHLEELCGPIIEIACDGVVQLVHFTAYDFLTKEVYGTLISPAYGHLRLASTCITYLSFRCFEDAISEEEVESCIMNGDYFFKDYAAYNWFYHVTEACAADPSFLESLIEEINKFLEYWIDPGSECMFSLIPETKLLAIKQISPPVYRKLSMIYSYQKRLSQDDPLRLSQTIQRIQERLENLVTANIDVLTKIYGSGLFRCPQMNCDNFCTGFKAKRERDKHVAKHSRPIKCDVKTCDYATLGFSSEEALQRHCNRYHNSSEVLNDPISYDSQNMVIPSTCNEVQTLFFDAISQENCLLLETLLRQDIDINITDVTGTPALHHAVKANSVSVVQLFLSTEFKLRHHQKVVLDALSLSISSRDKTESITREILKIFSPLSRSHTYELLDIAVLLGDDAKNTVQLILSASKVCKDLDPFGFTSSLAPYLKTAVLNGDRSKEIVRHLLENGVNSGIAIDGSPALHLAAKLGDSAQAVVALLLEAGADVNSTNSLRKTALHYAIASVSKSDNVIRLLLKDGAECIEDYKSFNPLDDMLSLSIRISASEKKRRALLLVQYGDNVKLCNRVGHSFLFIAVCQGWTEVVIYLLQKGADPKSKDYGGDMLLYLAIKKGNEEIALLLLEYGVDVEQKDVFGRNILALSVSQGLEKLTGELLQRGADTGNKDIDGNTLLQVAVEAGHEGVAIQMLAYTLDIEKKDAEGYSLLMHAIKANMVELVVALLKKRADIKSQSPAGETPLVLAVTGSKCEQRTQVIKSLLEYGADIDVNADMTYDSASWTLLHHCVLLGDIDNVEALLYYGADVNIRRNSITPLHLSTAPEITRLLLSAGADIEGTSSKSLPRQDTPLVRAFGGHYTNTKVLLENGANPNVSNQNASPLLYEALKSKTRRGRAMVELLLEYGADPELLVSRRNGNSNSILSTANWKHYLKNGGVYPVKRLALNPVLKDFVRKKQLSRAAATTASLTHGTSMGSEQAARILRANGMNPSQLTQQKLPAIKGRSINQMPIPKGILNIPQNALHGGSRVVPQTSPGGPPNLDVGKNANPAPQDYEMQLKILELQAKKNNPIARHAQINLNHHSEGQHQLDSFQSMSPGSSAATPQQLDGETVTRGQTPGQTQQPNSPTSQYGVDGACR